MTDGTGYDAIAVNFCNEETIHETSSVSSMRPRSLWIRPHPLFHHNQPRQNSRLGKTPDSSAGCKLAL